MEINKDGCFLNLLQVFLHFCENPSSSQLFLIWFGKWWVLHVLPGAKSQHSQYKLIWIELNFIYLCHLCWWSHFVWLCLRIKKIWNVSQVTIGPQLHWSCRESPHLTHRAVCIKFLAQQAGSKGKTCTQSLVSCCQIWAGAPVTACAVGESLN